MLKILTSFFHDSEFKIINEPVKVIEISSKISTTNENYKRHQGEAKVNIKKKLFDINVYFFVSVILKSKIFNDPVKIEGKPKISTLNENYKRHEGEAKVKIL